MPCGVVAPRGPSLANAPQSNGYTTPNSIVPDLVTHFTGFFGPRSWHPGGAFVMMGDSSVHFMSDSTNATILHSLHSISGHEPIPDME